MQMEDDRLRLIHTHTHTHTHKNHDRMSTVTAEPAI
jgi:hypothetical protein